MGCGASTDAQSKRAHGKPNHSSTYSSSTAYPHQVQPECASESEPEELTAEQLQLLAEIDARSACSTAESASEPGDFRLSVRIGIRVAKARLLHGIDGTCEEPKPAAAAGRNPTSRGQAGGDYGELKSRQIRKIQEWIDRMRYLNSDGFDTVPERWAPGNSATALDDVSEADTDLSPRSTPVTPFRSGGGDRGGGGGGGTMSVSDWGTPRHDGGGTTVRSMGYDDETVGHTPRLGRLPALDESGDDFRGRGAN